MMNPLKKSIIGSVILLTSLIMHYNQYRDNGSFNFFSSVTIFLILGSLAIYFEYGNNNDKTKTDSYLEK